MCPIKFFVLLLNGPDKLADIIVSSLKIVNRLVPFKPTVELLGKSVISNLSSDERLVNKSCGVLLSCVNDVDEIVEPNACFVEVGNPFFLVVLSCCAAFVI